MPEGIVIVRDSGAPRGFEECESPGSSILAKMPEAVACPVGPATVEWSEKCVKGGVKPNET